MAALITPLVTTEPAVAVSEMFPAAFVVMAPTVKLPTAKLKVKFKLLAVIVVRFKLEGVALNVYAVMPMPLLLVSNPIVCVVFAWATTIKLVNIPVEAACFK